MQRVVLDRALRSARIAHEAGAVQHLDGLLRGQPGSNQLAPSRVTQHQVRLDKTQGDVEICGNEALVNIYRRPRRGVSQGAMLGKFARVMIQHAIAGRGLFPADLT